MPKFIGRENEIKRLRQLLDKKTASFIVIRGRRRIGKSRLIQEFSKDFDSYYCFSGIPPTPVTTEKQEIDEFSLQISRNFNIPTAYYNDWSDAFWAVAEKLKTGKILLFFDEISWMGSKDPNFLGKIKNLWDLHLKQNDNLVFVVCGSASSWIEKNILSNTGFVGRISYTLTLKELPLQDAIKFWPDNISAYEKLKILSITGGIPKYLEEIDPKYSAEENIKRLCFTEGGLLVEEFKQIFSDIFLRDSEMYKKILEIIAEGPKDQTAILDGLKLKTPGRIPEYLAELEFAGFIARDYTWEIKTGKDSKLSLYRLQDNYMRFYLKYISNNLTQINRGTFAFKSLTSLPQWSSIMGLQFENLILGSRRFIHRALEIDPNDIICENPYFQRQTSRRKGCQIDYMIQTRFNTLYVCEIKFSRNIIDNSIIDEVQNKIDIMQHAKHFSCRPVLIHANGVSETVVESDFFVKIIDMQEILK